MFERQNQSVLTPHYTSLVSHEEDDDDLFTLARADHDLEGGQPSTSTPGGPSTTPSALHTADHIPADDLSKRKLKMATSKRGAVKLRPGPDKVVFDDEGLPTDFYKAGTTAEAEAAAERARFVEEENRRMREADKVDKEVAREKKREKKRKRKERERVDRDEDDDEDEDGEGASGEEMVAVIGGGGYESDDGAISLDEQEEEEEERGGKKRGKGKKQRREVVVDDEEELALRLLRGE